jgi:membrane associated rhomboid family serine protease
MSILDTPITLVITLATVGTSFLAFNNDALRSRLMFNPYMVVHRQDYWRLPGHAFIHADFLHLFFNMYVFFEFGKVVELVMTNEQYFRSVFPESIFWGEGFGMLYFATLYFGGVSAASLPAISKHRDNPNYNSLGASGAVSGVLLAYILMFPTSELMLLILPFFGIPAFVIGIFFFWYESYMNRKRFTNIAHDAHIFGALFGLVFMILIEPSILPHFFNAVKDYFLALF